MQQSFLRDTSSLRFELAEITLGELDDQWKINLSKFCSSLFPSYMNITKNTTIILLSDCPSRLVNFLKQATKRY